MKPTDQVRKGILEDNQIFFRNAETRKKICMRFLKSVSFWMSAAVLCTSSYKSIVKISGLRAISAEESKNCLQASLQDSKNAALVSEEEKTVALTFVDGPHPVYTKKLLDGLKERQVHATFFVVGKNIPGNESLISQMKEDGHLIGNHTYDHVKICDMSGSEACEQVEKTSRLVCEITGENTEFVRPPFGAWNKNMECSFVMLPVLWDVDPLDWTTRNTDLIVQRVLEEVEDGDIVLLHDYYDSSVEAAFQIIDELQTRGYTFVTADQMLLE